jgi:hypothetical protein
MARQSRTINPKVARALSHLDRMTNVARKSGRIARAAASIALAKEYRWQLPAEAVGLKDERFLVRRRTAGDGSGGGFGAGPGWNEATSRSVRASAGTRRHLATALVEAATRSRRQFPELSQAMKALSRIEHAVESGSAGRPILQARNYATPASGSSTSPLRAQEGLEAKVPLLAEKGLLANVRIARSIRGVTPPSNVSRREFAEPSRNARVSSEGSGRGGITINSSPTVVINGSGSGAVQHDVIGALRAHREELFDQLKRESARRERAQF